MSLRVSALLLGVALPVSAMAQGLGNRIDLEEIVVTASFSTLSQPSAAATRRQMEAIPGAVGFIESRALQDSYTESLGDALAFTPGVVADVAAMRESRISVRGSGLNSVFERRGLTVLRDGVPISRASGSTEFQEVDPTSLDWIEVYKGANGLRYGTASLGGAINIVSPTGRSLSGLRAQVEGGSHGSWRLSAQAGGHSDQADWWGGVTVRQSDGYRDHSANRGAYAFANVGLKLSPTVESRFYLTALTDRLELAGSLQLEDALENPEAAQRPTFVDAGPAADDWDRNLSVIRFSNRTVADLGAARLEAGAWLSWRGLDHAITHFAGIMDQSEDEVGGFANLSNRVGSDRRPVEWTLGLMANRGVNEALNYANVAGEKGVLRSYSVQKASNIQAYGQVDASLFANIRAIAGGQYVSARREAIAKLDSVSGELSYQRFSPRAGLLWETNPDWQIFANWSASYEPPTLSDLTAGGAYPFEPLKAQEATTWEIGSRGRLGRVAYDIALWDSRVRNEFIDTLAPNGRTSITHNADRTRKSGIEAGVDLFLLEQSQAGIGLVWRQVWTYSDFRFDNDATFGNNRLAGVPRHLVTSELKVDGGEAWFAAARLRWVPEGPFVDYANTEKAPGYAIVGLGAGWQITPALKATLTAENLFDKHFISNLNTVANQQAERAAAYTPGMGRSVYLGLSATF